MDIFDNKSASPMLIGESGEPFDSPDYIYELKLDGERCLAYLDKSETVLQNKRKLLMNTRFPELNDIHKNLKVRCILDGELTVIIDGKPNFEEVKRRSLMSNRFKIDLALSKYPACFTAFDILYYKDGTVIDKPLLQRKALLQKAIKSENERIATTRYIEGQGVALYNAAAEQGLEGVVAKRNDSLYSMGNRTKDWIKFKNLADDDFVILGYIEKDNNVVSLVLGQYQGKEMVYKGHVTLGVSREDFKIISTQKIAKPPLEPPKGNENAVWLKPDLVCTVKYMELTSNGGLRQPVYKGLRDDKLPKDCIVK